MKKHHAGPITASKIPAIRKGQIGSAQLLMRDLGAVVGEVAPEAQAAAAPVLRVEIDDKRAG